MKTIKKFKQFLTIPGWLKLAEGMALYYISKYWKGKGVFVEIGSFAGRSTAFLALGIKERNGNPLYAVDPLTGDPFEKKTYKVEFKKFKYNLKDEFINNMRKYDLKEYVNHINKKSEDAAKNFNFPIRFLFIDGIHQYEYVKRDFQKWKDKIVSNGILSFHDSNQEDTKRVLKEYLYPSDDFIYLGKVGTSSFFIKKDSRNIKNIYYEFKIRIVFLLLNIYHHISKLF